MKKTEKTKLQLKEAFFKIAENKLLFEITVNELCDKAYLSRTTFYNYYQDMNEFMREIENEVLINIKKAVENLQLFDFAPKPEDRESLYEVSLNFSKMIYSCKDNIKPFIGDNGDPYFKKKFKKILRDNYEKSLVKANRDFGKFNEYMLTSLSASALSGLSNWLLEKSNIKSIEENAEYVTDLMYFICVLAK